MRFLKLKEVMQKTTLSRSAIYRKMNDNNFPQSKMKFLKLQQVMDKTTLCRSSIYLLIKSGEFPGNYTVMGKRKAWLESEVDDWLMSKIESAEL